MPLIIDPDLLSDGSADNGLTEVFINSTTKTIKLNVIGNLSNTGIQGENGVSLKALYSFLKEEWRNDPNTKNLAAFDFPMVPITDESFEFVSGWDFDTDASRYLIRNAGWAVKNTSGATTQLWAGIVGLGSIEANDQIYYQQFVGGASANVQLPGQVNQAVQIYSDPNGDVNLADGYDRRSTFNLFVREYSQLYGKSSLADIGVSQMSSIAYRFPISTSADLNVEDLDATVSTNAPYNAITVKYFDSPYIKEVDSTTDRNFGIVIDVGTHSGNEGSASLGGSTLTTADGGIVGASFAGGTLTVHNGANQGTYTIAGTPTATTADITGTFPAADSTMSFTLQRATPITASAEQIYTKIQYLQRQNSDIDGTANSVVGKTADQLLTFIGSDLKAGALLAVNPNGGGSGVMIEGFAATDTNRIAFGDNSGTPRTYPFVASLTVNFGDNLRLDSSAKYWVYFSTLPGAGNDFGEPGATIAQDNSGTNMNGLVGAATSLTLSFNYDGNVQGGRTAGTDAAITVVGIGLQTGQYVKATGTIGRSTSNSVSLVAALERNYANN